MEYCGAPSRQTGKPCRKAAGWGTPHATGRCSLHLGNSPSHLAAAERKAQLEACRVLGLGLEVEADPAAALLGEVVRTLRAIAYYELAIEADGVNLYEPTRHASGELTGEAKPHVLVALLMAERKHLADVTAKALHAGVAQRQIELAEDTARQLVAVMQEFTRRLGLDPSSPEVRDAGRAAMMLVAGDRA